MAVHSYDKFIEPIVRYLVAHPTCVVARDAHEASALALGISEAGRPGLLPSSYHRLYKNHAGQAYG